MNTPKLTTCFLLFSWSFAFADLPVSGEPVPELVALDVLMLDFMSENGIPGALVGVMKDGVIVYQRGFGWSDAAETIAIEADAPMRIASVTKPITAAGIRILISRGLDINAHVFDLGQPGGGILTITPFPGLGDQRLNDITIDHCLRHRGGWDRDLVGDLTYMEILIANQMGIPSPPSRLNTLRYILGQPLQSDPGQVYAYSNIGFLVLGLVIEAVSGQAYMDFVFPEVFGESGMATSEIFLGRTFPQDRNPREPWYHHYQFMTQNVYDPLGSLVLWPNGGWNHEARTGQGAIVSTVAPLLFLLENRYIAGSNIGVTRTHLELPSWRSNHTGSLAGTNALARQRGDGINYVVLMNQRSLNTPSYTTTIRQRMDLFFDTFTGPWPQCTLGFFAQPENVTSCENGQVNFRVVSQGEDVVYQWRKDSVNISDSNMDTLSLGPINENDVGQYDCVISNQCGQLISQSATLSIDEPIYHMNLLPSWREPVNDPCLDIDSSGLIDCRDLSALVNQE